MHWPLVTKGGELVTRILCYARIHEEEINMATKSKRAKRREWTKEDIRDVGEHSRARTPVAKRSKLMKRTVGALRQKAFRLGLPLGHGR
jgi:hypothetical protein